MDLSQQIDLSSPDSKPPKPIGLGFGYPQILVLKL